MSSRGFMAHVDLTVTDLDRSCDFYRKVLGHLGFEATHRKRTNHTWYRKYQDGAVFEISLQAAKGPGRSQIHDRYAAGLHHLAFHVESRASVDRAHAFLCSVGARILDAPAEYSGSEYSAGYYAVFFADPDGMKLEVCYIPIAD